MDHGKGSGILGLLGLIAVGAAALLTRARFPSLSKFLLIALGVMALLVVILVAVVVFFAFHKPKKTPEQLKQESSRQLLQKSRTILVELRTRSMRIRQPEIRKTGDELCDVLGRILQVLKDQPEKLPGARSFLNQCLPMLDSVLLKYGRLEQSGTADREVTEKTVACLRDMRTAADRQYDNLFLSDRVDITAQMEVLTQICKRDGLLEEEFSLTL